MLLKDLSLLKDLDEVVNLKLYILYNKIECRCDNEFEWLMHMLEEGVFSCWEDVAHFIDDDLLELRYMKKRFGYLFFDHYKYIIKVNGRNAIVVDKDDNFVCRKPYDKIDVSNIDDSGKETFLYSTAPAKDPLHYDIKYLDEIDKGDPYVTNDDREINEEVAKTYNIIKKINLVKPEIFNSENFYEVLNSKEFDDIVLEKDKTKFYEQVVKYTNFKFEDKKNIEKLSLIDKISINSDGLHVIKGEDYITLVFMKFYEVDGELFEDGGDYVRINLPLPLRFDEEWFKKYKEVNLTERTIEDCRSEGYIKPTPHECNCYFEKKKKFG